MTNMTVLVALTLVLRLLTRLMITLVSYSNHIYYSTILKQ